PRVTTALIGVETRALTGWTVGRSSRSPAARSKVEASILQAILPVSCVTTALIGVETRALTGWTFAYAERETAQRLLATSLGYLQNFANDPTINSLACDKAIELKKWKESRCANEYWQNIEIEEAKQKTQAAENLSELQIEATLHKDTVYHSSAVSNLTKNKITALSKRPNSDVDSEDLKNNSFIVTEEQSEAPELIDSLTTPSQYTGSIEDLEHNPFIVTEKQKEAPEPPITPLSNRNVLKHPQPSREKLEDTNVELVLKKPQATEQIHPPEYSENPSEKTMRDGYSTTQKQYEIDIEDDDNVGNTSKRKTNEDDNDEELLENAIFLFNESNEESLIEKVDGNSLLDETRLPLGNINCRTPEEFLDTNLIESFNKYQKKIPKTRKILTPAYWGILDLTKESLNNSGIKNKEIEKLSQNFSNKIGWTDDVLVSNEVQKYFDNNCENEKQDVKEELKMWTTVPLFSGIFTSENIKNTWGEIQAISTNKARNENAIIYGEVSGGLASFGIPASCPKKQYVDKVKLMVMLRDSLNQFFKDKRHVKDKQRKELTVYGWLQIGIELKIYAMDWLRNL
ncbi:16946_t:CDS:10, partial [Funneliformis geosporum]